MKPNREDDKRLARSAIARAVVFVLALTCGSRAFGQTRVIVVGVDGMSVDGLTRAATPRMHELMERGAWTLTARGVLPTLSSPNWQSMFGGAPPEQHGVMTNGIFQRRSAFEPSFHDSDGKFPTIFGLLRQQRPESKIALFLDWEGFSKVVEMKAPDVMRHEKGPAANVEAAVEYWRRNRPTLMFIHLDNVDHTGHVEGWRDKAYYRALAKADEYVGRVMDMVTAEDAWDSTYVMVVSDHGGKRNNHGGNSLDEVQIPWIIAGPGVSPGQVTTAVNTYDTAVTLAWILGLETPQCWSGRPVLAALREAETLVAARFAQRGFTADALAALSAARNLGASLPEGSQSGGTLIARSEPSLSRPR